MSDPIYQYVEAGTEPLYQQYFKEALSKIDVLNFTDEACGRTFNRVQRDHDYEALEEIGNRAKMKNNLLPMVLQVMLEQYFWADAYLREKEQDTWIYRVMKRRDTDYFPDSMAVYAMISASSDSS
ncbi:MAG: hypothetical protein HY648_08235 [Acidobacteria bacterium]|nr:hypothetical protein [Acidobacteriota bacterium]